MAQKKAISNKSKKTKNPSKVPILKTSELPATQLMLTTLRKQIKSEINSLEKRLDSKFNQVDSKVELVMSKLQRMTILMEEQNSRNKFVLDGYASFYDRQERLMLIKKNIEDLILKNQLTSPMTEKFIADTRLLDSKTVSNTLIH